MNDHYVCPGWAVFTCITRGSYAIAWSSNVYIGSGGALLTFAEEDRIDAVYNSSNNPTFATLTQNALVNGSQVLESTLHINVQLNSPKASVICIHVGERRNTTTTFEVIGKKD